jgi:hypothetical protein|tara:strand:+ start:458 stop:1420 length:963 start_codon:yes stop_codon:yes gene_type:complete
MANPGLSEIVTTTLRQRASTFADNMSNHNALWNRINNSGNLNTVSGGRTLVTNLEYAETSTFQFYSGYEVLDISPSDVLTAAEFDWKQAAVNVTWSGLEADVQNAGKEALFNLTAKRIEVARKTMANNLSTALYSDGTGSAGKTIGGLQLLVADDPTTGTVGGIDRSTTDGSFWRNQEVSTATVTSTNIKTQMNTLWLECVRNNDNPNLIVMDNTFYSAYWASLQEQQRFTSSDMASAGFESLTYKGSTPVIFDSGGGAPASTAYFLNTDYIMLDVSSKRNFTPPEEKVSLNQDATVVPILWAGNMTLSNGSLQGVLKNS